MMQGSSGSSPRLLVVWNGGAGSSEQASGVLDELRGRNDVVVVESPSRESAMEAVQRSAGEGIERVIAAGGDGTVNAVVTALAELEGTAADKPALAILPLGTGNDLARSLGMPLEPDDALAICLSGDLCPMDLIEVRLDGQQSRVAGNMVTAGNTGKYVHVLTEDLKKRWGALCYLRGAVDVLENLEAFNVEIVVDNDPPLTAQVLNLFFANGRTSGGGMTVCADASLKDGLLDMLAIREGTGLDLATLTVDYLTSDIRENDLVFHRRCRSVKVRSSRPIPISTDGDPADATSIELVVKPQAIHAVQAREVV
jgi:diacylglycerol kinase (ATP)